MKTWRTMMADIAVVIAAFFLIPLFLVSGAQAQKYRTVDGKELTVTAQEQYVLEQTEKGEIADLWERVVLPLIPDQTRREQIGKLGLAAYVESLNDEDRKAFLKEYGKYRYQPNAEITVKFLETLLTQEITGIKIHRHGVIIRYATIIGPLDLINAEVPFEVDLRYCNFMGEVHFQKSQFHRNLSLVLCHFNDDANFSQMDVGKGAYFWGSQFEQEGKFDRITIGESINMESTKFKEKGKEKKADFSNIKIKGDAYFGEKVSFNGPLDFSRAMVGGLLDFGKIGEGATFSQGIDFSDSRVGSNLALRGALIRGPATFDGASIGGDLKAQGAEFQDPGEYASFKRMKVDGAANFEGAQFAGPVDFSGAEMKGRLLFEIKSAPWIFFQDAHFWELLIRGPMENDSRLKQDSTILFLTLSNTNIERGCTLEGITIKSFDAPQLQVKGLAALDRIKITDEVNLHNSNFQSLHINEVIWPRKKDNIVIDRLVFQDLSSTAYVRPFRDLLAASRFDPTSYDQLENYLKRQNLTKEADEVFREGQYRGVENLAWWKSPIKWWKRSYGWITGYGRNYSRFLWLVIFFLGSGFLWFDPKQLVGKYSSATMKKKNQFLLRLLISTDFFLPNLKNITERLPENLTKNLPETVTGIIKLVSIDLGLEKYWQPHGQAPKGITKIYIYIDKVFGLILTLVFILTILWLFLKKFFSG